MRSPTLLGLVASLSILPSIPAAEPLAATRVLDSDRDLSEQMVAGLKTFLLRETERAVERRGEHWRRDLSSREAYERSVKPNRERLAAMLGVVDRRVELKSLEFIHTTSTAAVVAENREFLVHAVRWPVLPGVTGEGLMLQPAGPIQARVVVLPDADSSPEQLAGLAPGIPARKQIARALALAGCQVVVPTLLDRRETWSGSERLGRFTNQPHREWIYRQSFEMGRHVIGYEIQKVLALVDWFTQEGALAVKPQPILVAGQAEGGAIALYAAALDTRISGTLVSGYFDSRQQLWLEPIYRNVFGLLGEFGDAELASLIHPRTLVIEHSEAPTISGPPATQPGRSAGAAPGKWGTPDFSSVEREVARVRALCGRAPMFIHGNEGGTTGPGSPLALEELLRGDGLKLEWPAVPEVTLVDARGKFRPEERQRRQVQELEGAVQDLLRVATYERDQTFWAKAKAPTAAAWETARQPWESNFWNQVIGRFPSPSVPADARSREIVETDRVIGYDVVLDVWPDVFAWGILLLPKDLKPGERRPVVVCQHGLEGIPMDTVTTDEKSRAWAAYKGFATRLAERGFVVFAPHNPYRGRDQFRELQRLANPLGKSLFSLIIGQHERILEWLKSQSFVDPKRIGFYGLSYGGKSAMRIPAVLTDYCLSICSADFNEWVWKNATVDWRGSYLFTGEYEIFEWNLGHTFNYAEMAALIAPRPFMVERGHDDGVGIDEWVNFEFAKVRRFYNKLGIGDRTEIEHFNGPHTINGQGTFDFLHRHLSWPKR